MKKLLFLMIMTLTSLAAESQHFFDGNFDPGCQYVILANPTANNIETIRFLTDNHILRVNRKNVQFVGIYHKDQAYDFRQSIDLIREKKLTCFHLQEIPLPLGDEDVFRENSCTELFRKIFRNSVGIFFFGGPDIQPEIYGEQNTRSVVTDPVRHRLEVSLLFHLIGGAADPSFIPFLEEKPGYLVTGFCLGLQTMNVAAGGTLVQDIPLEVYGRETPREIVTLDRNNLHRNYWQELNQDSQLMGINFHPLQFTSHPFFGKNIKVSKYFHPLIYSSHHQSLENVGMGFEVTALSPDGKVIEGLAHKRYLHVFGVQFHPEVPALYENREEWKYTPDGVLQTYHRIIGKESVDFHKRYWGYISKCLKKSAKN